MDDTSRYVERLTSLETVFMHLQRTLEDLDAAVLAQQRQLDALESRVRALAKSAAGPSDERGADEAPPTDWA